MRNSKRIFNEAEAAHRVYGYVVGTHPSSDSAQLPQNVPEGNISSFEQATDEDWKFTLKQALEAHPTEAVIIIVDDYTDLGQNLCNDDIAKVVADFRKIRPLTIWGVESAVEA